jgi:hypothetical protein
MPGPREDLAHAQARRTVIPHVTFNPESGTIHLYRDVELTRPALFDMDTEETRELIAMLVGSIVRIEGKGEVDRLVLLFDELLVRARKVG